MASLQNRWRGCLSLDPEPQAACLPHGMGHHPTFSPHSSLSFYWILILSDGPSLRVFAGCFVHAGVSQKSRVDVYSIVRLSDGSAL